MVADRLNRDEQSHDGGNLILGDVRLVYKRLDFFPVPDCLKQFECHAYDIGDAVVDFALLDSAR